MDMGNDQSMFALTILEKKQRKLLELKRLKFSQGSVTVL